MKQADVQVGGHYSARISGRLTIVRIKCVYETPRPTRKRWLATNLMTNRDVTIKSAQKLRIPMDAERAVRTIARYKDIDARLAAARSTP